MVNISIKEFLKNPKSYIKITKKPFIIGICGGSGSGKGFISNIIKKNFNARYLSTDDYYLNKEKVKENNYDSPNAVDLLLLKKHLKQLSKGKIINKPIYDFSSHSRKKYIKIKSGKVIIIEGIFSLNKILLSFLDLKIFVDSPEKTRFKRRLKRDVVERNRTKKSIITQWNKIVKPMYKKYILPQKEKADIIIKN